MDSLEQSKVRWDELICGLNDAESLLADILEEKEQDSEDEKIETLISSVNALIPMLESFSVLDRNQQAAIVSGDDASQVFNRLMKLQDEMFGLRTDFSNKIAKFNQGQRGIQAYKKV